MRADLETKPQRHVFAGAGVEIVGDIVGNPAGHPVLLMHGGGQTRHSWSAAMSELGRRGYFAVSIDMRGHGDSQWSADGNYDLSRYRDDVYAVIDQLPAPPVLVGASLGGISALLAIGESEQPIATGLVLVDIAPRMEPEGVERIRMFMNANLDGFETLDQVADAVAAYNPARPRPRNPQGLLKNLRERGGRYFWHWDPAILPKPDVARSDFGARLDEAAVRVRVPTMLVRGGESDIVSEESVAHIKALIPQAESIDIPGAGHMVAGDRNDAFNAAVFNFLDKYGL